jgi:hypothetical protein
MGTAPFGQPFAFFLVYYFNALVVFLYLGLMLKYGFGFRVTFGSLFEGRFALNFLIVNAAIAIFGTIGTFLLMHLAQTDPANTNWYVLISSTIDRFSLCAILLLGSIVLVGAKRRQDKLYESSGGEEGASGDGFEDIDGLEAGKRTVIRRKFTVYVAVFFAVFIFAYMIDPVGSPSLFQTLFTGMVFWTVLFFAPPALFAHLLAHDEPPHWGRALLVAIALSVLIVAAAFVTVVIPSVSSVLGWVLQAMSDVLFFLLLPFIYVLVLGKGFGFPINYRAVFTKTRVIVLLAVSVVSAALLFAVNVARAAVIDENFSSALSDPGPFAFLYLTDMFTAPLWNLVSIMVFGVTAFAIALIVFHAVLGSGPKVQDTEE